MPENRKTLIVFPLPKREKELQILYPKDEKKFRKYDAKMTSIK
jgi:hypothetical protein